MKVFLFLACLLAGLCACSNTEPTTHKNASPRHPLAEALTAMDEAYRTCDIAAVDSLTTGEYLHTSGGAKEMDKATWLRYLGLRCEEVAKGALTIQSYALKTTSIVYYDDVAVVTGEITQSLVPQENAENAYAETYRTTQVWTHQSGDWKCAAFHDAKIH